jgi:hypothetical protein
VRWPPLATASELLAIGERALAQLAALDEEAVPWDRETDAQRLRRYWRGRSAVEALRFVAAAGLALRTPSLAPLLARAVEAVHGRGEHLDKDLGLMAEGLQHALAQGAAAEIVEDLVAHPDAAVRRALAAGLRPARAPERALLERLARDPVADVRGPAREALAALGEVPWWAGKWSRDPLAGLSPEEAEAHRAAIEQIAAVLDRPRYHAAHHDAELAAVASSLPDAVVVDLAETALSAPRSADTRMPALGALLVARAGGEEALLRLCQRWAKLPGFAVDAAHVAMITGAPRDRRVAVCLALGRRAARLGADLADEGAQKLGTILAKLAGEGFPPEEDPTPLLELALTCPTRAHRATHWIAHALVAPLGAGHALPAPLLERMFEAHVAGLPGAWWNVCGAVRAHLARAPREAQRALAERAIQSDDEGTVAFGLGALVLDLHEPGRDPPVLELVAGFWEDPRLRAVLLSRSGDLRLALAGVRAALRRGGLDFETAERVVDTVGWFWGGPAGRGHARSKLEAGSAEAERRLARYEACLGPEDLRGPVTAEEWALLRAARGRHPIWDTSAFRVALRTLPAGPWDPEDRAVLERALRHVEEEDRELVFLCGMAVEAKITREDLPILERLRELAPDPEDREHLEELLHDARAQLGLLPAEDAEEDGDAEEAPAAQGSGREWMDELEDD